MTETTPPIDDALLPLTQSHYRAVLEWYQAMGVDAAVATEPTDWFNAEFPVFSAPAPSPLQAQPQPTISTTQQKTAPTRAPAQKRNTFSKTSADASNQEARNKAAEAPTIEALRHTVEQFEGCGLKVTATKTCFSDGNPDAPLMIIGEAPGGEEDIAGKPFVGRAGLLLNKMLKAIDVDRAQGCYITNIVFWRPPGNRTPSPQEVESCKPFVERQIELVNPKAILLLGAPAAKSLLDSNVGILKLRGKWKSISINDVSYPIIASLHPAYLLRTPTAKMLAWQDMLAVKEKLESE